ncbi:hypothetical protein CR513_19350, partial [Mucuna pruriens]
MDIGSRGETKEYEHILGQPLVEIPPYLYQGHHPSWNIIAKLLKVYESKMAKRRLSRNNVDGLSRSYLEGRMKHFSKSEDWVAFSNILGLVVYEIVLFPHLDNYVDIATIDAFLAY